MRTHTITRTVAGGVLLLMTGAGVACSKGAAAFESPYCNVARQWTVHEFTPVDEGNPAAMRPYWKEYLAFVDNAVRLAPKAVHSDWVVSANAIKNVLTPVLEKYGFDQAQIKAKGTDAEKAMTDSPPPNVEKAQDAIHNYEALVCSAHQPQAAAVTFKGEKPGAYCDAVKQDNENNQSIDFSDPASVRMALTDPDKKKAAAETDARFIATAPKVIKDDVKANVDWWNTKQKPVQAKYGYDMAKLILHGSAKEVAALQLTDKKIRDHYARALAYEQQVCGQ